MGTLIDVRNSLTLQCTCTCTCTSNTPQLVQSMNVWMGTTIDV